MRIVLRAWRKNADADLHGVADSIDAHRLNIDMGDGALGARLAKFFLHRKIFKRRAMQQQDVADDANDQNKCQRRRPRDHAVA